MNVSTSGGAVMPDVVVVFPGCAVRRNVPLVWVRVVVLVLVMAFATGLLWSGHAVPMVVWVLTVVGGVTLMVAPAPVGGLGTVWVRRSVAREFGIQRHA